MSPREYAEQFIRESVKGRTREATARIAAHFIRVQMENHVREHLGESPSNADSNVNVSWLGMMGGIVHNLEHP